MQKMFVFILLTGLLGCTSFNNPQFQIDGHGYNSMIERRKEIQAPFNITLEVSDMWLMRGMVTNRQTRLPVAGVQLMLHQEKLSRPVVSNSDGSFSFNINEEVQRITVEAEGYPTFDINIPKHYWDQFKLNQWR